MIRVVFLSCFLGLVPSLASGAIVTDISNMPGNGVGFSPINPNAPTGYPSGQSFVVGTGINNIAGGRVFILPGGSASQMTMELYNYSDLGTNPTALGSATVTGPFSGVTEVLFSSPVSVTSGAKYFFMFHAAIGDSGFFSGITATDSYTAGDALTNPNSTSATVFAAPPIGPYDFEFETLTDDSITPVPEPSGGFLAVIIAMGVGLRRPRRVADSTSA